MRLGQGIKVIKLITIIILNTMILYSIQFYFHLFITFELRHFRNALKNKFFYKRHFWIVNNIYLRSDKNIIKQNSGV